MPWVAEALGLRQDSGSGPVDGQSLPTGHSQLLGWVKWSVGEREWWWGGEEDRKGREDSTTLHGDQCLDILPASLVSWDGTLPACEVGEEALYQESELWEWGQASV